MNAKIEKGRDASYFAKIRNYLPERSLSLGLSVAFFVTLTPSEAALSLVVDTLNQTIALTGSDSGTDTGVNNQRFSWELGSFSQRPAVVGSLGATVSPGAWTSGPTVQIFGDQGLRLFGITDNASGTLMTMTGTGGTTSYASLTDGQKEGLESFIGSSIPATNATGVSSLAVILAVIPEPSTTGLLLMGGLGLLARRRRLTA